MRRSRSLFSATVARLLFPAPVTDRGLNTHGLPIKWSIGRRPLDHPCRQKTTQAVARMNGRNNEHDLSSASDVAGYHVTGQRRRQRRRLAETGGMTNDDWSEWRIAADRQADRQWATSATDMEPVMTADQLTIYYGM
jgi:hypothetical protein